MTMPQQLPSLYLRLLRDITDDLLPPRRTRINPRVDKRRMPEFGHSRSEHYHWLQPQCSFREAVAFV